MFRFLKYLILLLVHFCISNLNYGQTLYYQDVFHGNVCVVGLSSWDSTHVVLNNFGSTQIRKAFLISGNQIDNIIPGANYQKPITINGYSFVFDNSTQVTNRFNAPYLQNSGSVHLIDVTNAITTNVFDVYTPVQTFPPGENINQRFFGLSLVVLYDNPLKSKVCFSLWPNTNNIQINIFNQYLNLMPIDTNNDVALSLSMGHMMNTVFDGSYVWMNSDSLGLIGGPSEYNVINSGTILGQFSFHNDTLYGIGDDTPDDNMAGSDVLANISSYIPNFSTSFTTTLNYQTPGNVLGSTSNPIWATFIAYTSPCDTFTAGVSYNDTILCDGDSIQLTSYGGQKYLWKPNISLSCDTCSNPIANPDSSIHYTVQIWNTDSCSKIFPVKVIVRPPIAFTTTTSPVTCGLQDGSIAISNVQNVQNPITYFLNGIPQATNMFVNLDTGNYNISLTDSNGCSSTTAVISLSDTNYVTANFAPSSLTGVTPLDINFTYTGNNGNNFVWTFGNGDSSLVMDPFYTYNNSGSFIVTLITWANDSSCSDTATQIILVDPALIITQLITPNNDGKNDSWIISGLSQYPNTGVEIFNRWGNRVYSSEPYQNDWAGQCIEPICLGNGILPAGTYFYYVYLHGKNNTQISDIKSGYLELQP